MVLDNDVPWGRRPVPGIPVPPFRSADDAAAFHEALAEYVGCLADRSGNADPMPFAVIAALRARDRTYDDLTWPEEWVLRIAIHTFFPAPWTPVTVADAVNATRRASSPPLVARRHRIEEFGDPELRMFREDGGWVAYLVERGQERVDAVLGSDDDAVLYLMSRERSNPYPYGWLLRDNEQRIRALAAAAGPAVEAWRRHANLPYIADWRNESG